MAKKKYSSKYWFKNEKEVMKKLGLEPVPGSGSGIKKEDGENDYILCQLKSTSAESISIKKIDIEKLFYHADQLKKIPIFAIQFLNGPLVICTPPNELKNLHKYLNNELFEKAGVEHLEVKEQRKERRIIKGTSKKVNLNSYYDSGKKEKEKDAFQVRKERKAKEERLKRRMKGLE